MRPAASIARETGAFLFKDKCVRVNRRRTEALELTPAVACGK